MIIFKFSSPEAARRFHEKYPHPKTAPFRQFDDALEVRMTGIALPIAEIADLQAIIL